MVHGTDSCVVASRCATLGSFHVRQGREILCFEYVHAQAGAWADMHVEHDLPVTLCFLYSGKADMEIRTITFSRKKEE